MVVDDSPIITERIAAMAREPQCVSKVFISADYDNALKIIENEQPNIALLDIDLPYKSGIELLIFMRKNFPFIKVIMVTNKASAFYRDICKMEGADYFIDKSKEFENIPEIIEAYC